MLDASVIFEQHIFVVDPGNPASVPDSSLPLAPIPPVHSRGLDESASPLRRWLEQGSLSNQLARMR